jgi:hypothetical protein
VQAGCALESATTRSAVQHQEKHWEAPGSNTREALGTTLKALRPMLGPALGEALGKSCSELGPAPPGPSLGSPLGAALGDEPGPLLGDELWLCHLEELSFAGISLGEAPGSKLRRTGSTRDGTRGTAKC